MDERTNHGDRMNRRTLLGAMGASFLLSTLRLGWLPDAVRASKDASGAMRRAGRIYLKENPEEADIGRLRRLAGIQGPILAPDWTYRFGNLRRAEFEAGNTVIIDGWILAKYEARLCALVALV